LGERPLRKVVVHLVRTTTWGGKASLKAGVIGLLRERGIKAARKEGKGDEESQEKNMRGKREI